MTTHGVRIEVRGPWSLATSRLFWEGFAPAALTADEHRGEHPSETDTLHTVFRVDADWSRAATTVRQRGSTAQVDVEGDGDLDAAAAQVGRFLALDVDATAWPDVGDRDPVLGALQEQFPGLRPCGFHSPYEAAAWAVLSQRVRIPQAAALRRRLIERFGDDGAFPAPAALRAADLDLPGRKAGYLHAVADAALAGALDGRRLRSRPPERAVADLQGIAGIGPFAAELVVLRGANAPDALPQHERRLDDEISERYGPGSTATQVAEAWRPLRTWACVHLRAAREARLQEITPAS